MVSKRHKQYRDVLLGFALLSLILASLFLIFSCNRHETWSVTQKGNDLQIAYGRGMDSPQHASLDLSSSYFRIIPPDCTWGTSVVLFPSFFEGGEKHQGTDYIKQLNYTWRVKEGDLILSIDGEMTSNVRLEENVRISPPQEDSISAKVSINIISEDIKLDKREVVPSEAFQLVMLSSMHISEEKWDAKLAYADSKELPIPESGWIVQPSKVREEGKFGLKGGKSKWQEEHANLPSPTIEICLDEPYEIVGWVMESKDPNDDNIGFWAGSDKVICLWEYTIIATSK